MRIKLLRARLNAALSQNGVFLATLLLTALGTYGYSLRQMGFYWDDWQAVFIGRLGDPSLFHSYFAYDRPLSGWTYELTFPLFGSNPAAWQLFTITLRWLTSVGMWLALRGLWLAHAEAAGWMALLLMVYPGFLQQPVSVAYSQHFMCYALFTFSLAAMVWAYRRPRWFYLLTALSVIAGLAQMLTMEYFSGLEMLRPLILWFLLADERQPRTRVKLVLRRYLPYALALVVFLVYRFMVFPQLSPDPDSNKPLLLMDWRAAPWATSVHLLQMILQDSTHMLLFAWTNMIKPQVIDLNAGFTLFSWLVGALLAGLSGMWLLNAGKKAAPDAAARIDRFGGQVFWLGGAALLLGGLPIWVTNRQVILGTWSDRFSLAPMFGVVILVVALANWLVNQPARRTLALALIAAVAISGQVRNVNNYSRNWALQKEYYWQMVWRMPALAPGTALLGEEMPFGLVADYSIGFMTNILYAPELRKTQAPYWFFDSLRYRGGVIADFTPDSPIRYKLRTVEFSGSTSASIVLAQEKSNQCLRVVTSRDIYSPDLSANEDDLLNISNPHSIIAAPPVPARPPAEIFGDEVEHGWCYYYQKADLARQLGEWSNVVAIFEEADRRGLRSKFGFEYLPFVDGYAHLGNWQRAYELSVEAGELTVSMQPLMCRSWSLLDQETQPSPQKVEWLNRLNLHYDCE